MIRRIAIAALSVVGLPLLLTCGGDPSGTGPVPPDPGPVELRLVTSNSDLGIMRIVVIGGTVSGVRSPAYELQWATFGADSTVILIRGDLVSGIVAELTLPDRGALAGYSARVDQAASRQTYQRRSVADDHMALVKP